MQSPGGCRQENISRRQLRTGLALKEKIVTEGIYMSYSFILEYRFSSLAVY